MLRNEANPMNHNPPVTVTHIPLTREIYNELLSALDTEQEEYGRTAEGVNARRWLHYRWAAEGKKERPAGEGGAG